MIAAAPTQPSCAAAARSVAAARARNWLSSIGMRQGPAHWPQGPFLGVTFAHLQ